MAISHVTKKYAVDDAKIYVLTADPSGGSATYGSAIDVPGIKSITLDGSMDVKSLRGDNQELDAMSSLSSVTGTINYAKESLDVAAALLGLSVTDAGSGSTETATLEVLGSTDPAYVKLEAKCPSVDLVGGDLHLTLHKIIPTGLPISGLAEEDYQLSAIPFRAVPLISSNKWLTVVIHETAAALSS